MMRSSKMIGRQHTSTYGMQKYVQEITLSKQRGTQTNKYILLKTMDQRCTRKKHAAGLGVASKNDMLDALHFSIFYVYV